MTRRQLRVLWRVLAAAVAVTGVAVVAVAVLPQDLRIWPAVVAMSALVVSWVLVWRRRPRSKDTRWPRRRDEADLAAIPAGEPIATDARRDAALLRARQGVCSELLSVPTWGFQALVWGSDSWSPVWLRAGVLPLVVVGTAWLLYRTGRRIAVIDHYDDTCPPVEATSTSTAS